MKERKEGQYEGRTIHTKEGRRKERRNNYMKEGRREGRTTRRNVYMKEGLYIYEGRERK